MTARVGLVLLGCTTVFGAACPGSVQGDDVSEVGADVATDAGADVATDAGADTIAAQDTSADAGNEDWGFEQFAAEYGVLETVAGLGTEGDKAVNGWLAAFEGGPAVAVELSRPHIALADEAGRIFIADKDAHAIRRVDLDGSIHTVAGTNVAGDDGDAPGPAAERRLSSPNGVWVRSDGVFYVLDLGNDKVRRVAADGTMTTLFTIAGAGTGRGLWVADDESLALVSAGSALKRWTPSAGVEVVSGGYSSLGNLSVEPSGTVLFADRDEHRVYRYDPTTEEAVIVAGNGTKSGGGDGAAALETGLDEVRGVWAHPRGGYLLATHKGGQVWFVDTAGLIHLFVHGDADRDTHGGDGQPVGSPGLKISEPRAVTMDPAGNVLITENDRGFIRRVRRLP